MTEKPGGRSDAREISAREAGLCRAACQPPRGIYVGLTPSPASLPSLLWADLSISQGVQRRDLWSSFLEGKVVLGQVLQNLRFCSFTSGPWAGVEAWTLHQGKVLPWILEGKALLPPLQQPSGVLSISPAVSGVTVEEGRGNPGPESRIHMLVCLHQVMLLLFSHQVMSSSLQPNGLYSTPGSSVLHCIPELLKFMSIESLMLSNPLILCWPLFLLLSIFLSIRVFSSESALHIKWPKYWSISISPSNEHSRLISFRIDWFDLLCCPRDPQVSSPAQQFKSINSLVLSLLYGPTLTPVHGYWKKKPIALTFVGKVMSLLFIK